MNIPSLPPLFSPRGSPSLDTLIPPPVKIAVPSALFAVGLVFVVSNNALPLESMRCLSAEFV